MSQDQAFDNPCVSLPDYGKFYKIPFHYRPKVTSKLHNRKGLGLLYILATAHFSFLPTSYINIKFGNLIEKHAALVLPGFLPHYNKWRMLHVYQISKQSKGSFTKRHLSQGKIHLDLLYSGYYICVILIFHCV